MRVLEIEEVDLSQNNLAVPHEVEDLIIESEGMFEKDMVNLPFRGPGDFKLPRFALSS